jgi:ferric-dicitrate binding protein FerR (iron transport regulator)
MNSDNDKQTLDELRRQLDRSATYEEKRELASKISTMEDEDIDEMTSSLWEDHTPHRTLSEEKSKRILTTILASEKKPTKHLRHRTTILRAIAIAASILLVASAGIYLYRFENSRPHLTVIAKAVNVSPAQPVRFNRHLTLPDGSMVILKEGSRLVCPQRFTGSARVVALEGEAYFDIRHQTSQPFIIHTGAVTTTVLGTAFNIKSDRNGVRVSVARGKVRVEKDGRTMAVLGVNETVTCHTTDNLKELALVKTDISSQWVKEGMDFDHTPMTEVAQTLSRRYGVNIAVSSPEIEKLIFVSTFTGTESLDEVLTVLCSLMPDMSYKIEGNNVSIFKSNN